MKLTIEIDLDNDAFQNGARYTEVLRIIKHMLSSTLSLMRPGSIALRDVNGNTCGFARVERS